VADVYVSDAKLWQGYRDEHDSVTIRLVALVAELAVPDSAVFVDDAEVKVYYDRHRAEFERKAVAYLSYVAVPREANAADTALALERAQSIRREIAGGADFAALARRESHDSVSAAQGGDLGEATRGQFVPQFEEAALALRPGQLSQPVLSPFGYHIIRLESRSGSQYRARHVLIRIELGGEHLDRVDAQIDSLERRAADQLDPTALDAGAAALGIPVRLAVPLIQGERVQAPPYVAPDAGLWAFEAVVGETSLVIEAERASFVFRLDSLTPGGIPRLEQVRETVRRRVISEKKKEALRQAAGRSAADVASGGLTLERLAEHYRASVVTVGPFTRANPAPDPREDGARAAARPGPVLSSADW